MRLKNDPISIASSDADQLGRKTIAAMRSCVADFLRFLAATGRTACGLADRLPPHRHVRHESEPHLWTADEIGRVLAAIDRQSVIGKRDYAMILTTARLGLRISDLRQLELGDLDWRAKTITIVQRKTGRRLSLPLLDDVGWAIIDYVRDGRPETACPKVSSSIVTRSTRSGAPRRSLAGSRGTPPGRGSCSRRARCAGCTRCAARWPSR